MTDHNHWSWSTHKSMPFMRQLTAILVLQDSGLSYAVYSSTNGLCELPPRPGIHGDVTRGGPLRPSAALDTAGHVSAGHQQHQLLPMETLQSGAHRPHSTVQRHLLEPHAITASQDQAELLATPALAM